jgi:hypothetical protein
LISALQSISQGSFRLPDGRLAFFKSAAIFVAPYARPIPAVAARHQPIEFQRSCALRMRSATASLDMGAQDDPDGPQLRTGCGPAQTIVGKSTINSPKMADLRITAKLPEFAES